MTPERKITKDEANYRQNAMRFPYCKADPPSDLPERFVILYGYEY